MYSQHTTLCPFLLPHPIWIAAGAFVNVCADDLGEREIPMSEFFVDYRRTALKPTEIIRSVFVPHLQEHEYVEAYKQSRRREDDLAIVNAGMRVRLAPDTQGELVVQDVCIAYGGVHKKVIRAEKTEAALQGKAWNQTLLDLALNTIPSDIPLATDAPGGMVEFRRTLTTTLFFKFYLTVLSRLDPASLEKREASAIERIHRPVSCATHLYETPLVGKGGLDTIGQPVPHLAAEKQV